MNHELDPFLKEAAWLDPKEALEHKNLQMIVLQGGKKASKDDYHLPVYFYNKQADLEMNVEHVEYHEQKKKEVIVDEKGREWEEVSLSSSIIVQVGDDESSEQKISPYEHVVEIVYDFWGIKANK